MPPRKRGALTKSRDDDDSPQPSKRTKTSSTAAPSGKKLTDAEGNPYWELGGRLRRVTVSEFKGKILISIREHYEKDGNILPGKKGISLSVEQFNTLLSVLPQLDSYLAENDISLTRPIYGLLNSWDKEKEDSGEEEEGKEKEMKEVEHEEGEDEEEEGEEGEDGEEEKPKKKPVPKKAEHGGGAEPKRKAELKKKAEPQKKLKAKVKPKKAVQSDVESD